MNEKKNYTYKFYVLFVFTKSVFMFFNDSIFLMSLKKYNIK